MGGRSDLAAVYRRLRRRFGHQGWWPGRTRLEIILGAILTQSAAWTNVERAIAYLRRAGMLRLERLHPAPPASLAALVRPSGYFRQKAKKIRAFLRFLEHEFAGSLDRMARVSAATLRPRLLGVFGIGPETADSILLYAFGRPVFVVDAYTRRVLARHGWLPADAPYEDVRAWFESRLPRSVPLWNDFHAQFVRLGKDFCAKRSPRCAGCPLRKLLPGGAPRAL